MPRTRIVRLLPLALLLAACASTPAPPPSPPPPSTTAASTPPSAPSAPAGHGVDIAGMDRTVAPGDDFYAFASGNWTKSAQIPPDRSSYDSLTALSEEVLRRTRELLETAAASGAASGTDAQRVGDYYASFVDEAGIEAKGLAPIQPALAKLAAMKTPKDLARALGETLRADVDPLNRGNFYTDHILGLWVAQDFQDPSRYAPYLLQGGLGMPDRDYYLSDAPQMADIRAKYQAHLVSLMKLAGISGADAKAARIVALERKIAKAQVSHVDSEDVHRANNPWSKADFRSHAPGLDWATFFDAAGLGAQDHFIVWQPPAVTGIAALVGQEKLDTWKEYLAVRAIEHSARVLPAAVVNEDFAFNGKVLTGTPSLRDRWKRAVGSTNEALGDEVGQLYVKRYFPPEAKAKAQAMVANIVAAFGRRIDALAWMAPVTKAKAKEKLSTLYVGVGYPDKWRDDTGLQIVLGDAFGNEERAEKFAYQSRLKRLGQPVDKAEWSMEAQTINAQNMPLQNALSFPAAILAPPLFDPAAIDAVNYGGMGAIIGHEISHSFDDQGSQFDAAGRVANWWTKEDLAHFNAAAAKLVAQYDAYHPFPDAAVNGKLVLSENIADVAGLSAAYDGYRAAQGQGQEAAARVDGFTQDQQFFLAFAQSWRQKMREPAQRQRLLTDAHAPPPFRALTVRNLDPWYAAFDVKPGQALYLAPADRVRVW